MDALLSVGMQVAKFLGPYLPSLLKGGSSGAESDSGFEKARALWGLLGQKPEVAEVAQAAAESPDESRLGALGEAISKVLSQSPDLLEKITSMVPGLDQDLVGKLTSSLGGGAGEGDSSAGDVVSGLKNLLGK
ncbi:MAG: hypothetical protein GXO20_03320 [Thermodesulfobacteria bacterium]|nr:hypothetical protein [Thermodesulfobacteriota bacterium]